MSNVTGATPSALIPAAIKIEIDRYDSVSATISQLAALLTSISGQGFETFSAMTEGYQGDLLWLACELACQAKATLSGGSK